MESKILGRGRGFVQFSNFIYVTYCHLACFRHLWGPVRGKFRQAIWPWNGDTRATNWRRTTDYSSEIGKATPISQFLLDEIPTGDMRTLRNVDIAACEIQTGHMCTPPPPTGSHLWLFQDDIRLFVGGCWCFWGGCRCCWIFRGGCRWL